MLKLVLFIFQVWCVIQFLCRLPLYDQIGVDLDYFLSIVNKTT